MHFIYNLKYRIDAKKFAELKKSLKLKINY